MEKLILDILFSFLIPMAVALIVLYLIYRLVTDEWYKEKLADSAFGETGIEDLGDSCGVLRSSLDAEWREDGTREHDS